MHNQTAEQACQLPGSAHVPRATDLVIPAVLAAPQAADYVGIGTSLLAELTARGEIPSLKISSRRLYRRAALDSWLEKLEAAQVSP